MSGIDIPHPVQCHNTGQEPTLPSPKPPPPSYGNGSEVHHHQYQQAPVDVPKPAPWYKRPCILATAIALLVVGITLRTALPIAFKAPPSKETSTTTTTSSTKSIPSTIHSDLTITVSQIVSKTSTKPSVITVVMTADPVSSTDGPQTLTQTITQSGDNIAELLSSLLPHYSLFPTHIVTLSKTAEESSSSSTTSQSTSSTTSWTTTTESSSSSPSTTSSFSSEASTTNSSSQASSSPTTSSTNSPTTPISTPTPSPIATNSYLAAVDVNIGPSDLHRRLLLWQDADSNLIASDSAKGTTNTYKVLDGIDSRARKKVQPTEGTAITATATDDGSIHVFYVTDSRQLVHLMQRRAGDWYYFDIHVKVASHTPLSATWHTIGSAFEVMVVMYVDDKHKLSVLVSDSGEPDDWQITDVNAFEDRTLDDLQSTGLSVISGVAYPNTVKSKPKLGDYADLSVLLANGGNTSWANCIFSKDRISSCKEYSRNWFPDGEGDPVKESSHAVRLAWSAVRPSNGAPPTVYGFMALDLQDYTLSEYRMLPATANPAKGAAQIVDVRWETQKVVDKIVDAIAMTDERTLFALAGNDLYEFELEDDEWKMRQKVDTRLTED